VSLQLYIYEKLKSGLGFIPTSCQDKFFHALSEFMVDKSGSDIFLINGYAGTGKTSSVFSLIAMMDEFGLNYVLLAPTGRAAKVLSGYTGKKAYTIHKQIYRQKSLKEGVGHFVLDLNKNSDTVFVVDEASLISSGYNESAIFGSGNLLDDLVTYVRSSSGNRLLLIGDSAQLPPVGETISKALDINTLSRYGIIKSAALSSVVRQVHDSGILHNATILRQMIETDDRVFPKFKTEGFNDVLRITGGELIEKLSDSYDSSGMDETLVVCRSNRQANRYNMGIRSKLLYREEQINRGDKVMIVKNCYQFLEDVDGLDFIANGDVAELVRISNYEERYGLNFAQATLKFPDYNDIEISGKVILDTLSSESANLGSERSRALFFAVYEDYDDIKNKRKRIAAVREDKYYNALQIKYSNAITVHKSQGGQWKNVYIDNPFYKGEITIEDLKWLYTAITRAVDKVYFVNFDDRFF
jgi:ATP-dependent exoDNAse (exonuclease V), alpha subunit - helicase superfamily I member